MSAIYHYPRDEEFEATAEADREWFAAHPDRVTRIRPLTDGDLQGDGVDAIIVFCPVDSFCMRVAVKCVPGTLASAWRDGAPHIDSDLLPAALKDVHEGLGHAYVSSCIDALFVFAKTGQRLPDFPPRDRT